MQSPTLGGRLPYAAQVVLLAAGYFAAAKLSLLLAIPPGYATPVWPPSGIALAAVLLLGRRVWPGIWLGAAAANLTVEAAPASALVIAAGNTLEAVAGAMVVRRFIGNFRHFERGEDVVTFVAAAALCATIAATIGLVPLAAGPALPWSGVLAHWWTWWQGDVSGIIIVTPLLLSWSTRQDQPWPRARMLELACFAALLFAAAAFAFGGGAPSGYSMRFLVLPFIIWAAFRFSQREVVTASAAIAAVSVHHALSALRGPEDLNETLLLLLAFNSILVVTGLVLSAVVGERSRAMDGLRQRQAELESRVDARTRELETSNRALQLDIIERERMEKLLVESELRLCVLVENLEDARNAAEKANHAKSEFLAKMSHELRTPLNSLLLLARLLADNASSNLTPKQVQYAETIHGAGMDLLSLINDILDLARIESGAITELDVSPVSLAALQDYVESTFRQLAQHKGLRFEISIDERLPATILTDGRRLQQVLKNLLANAFKFTRQGGVTLHVAPATSGWAPGHERLDHAGTVAAFSVMDTGIGIAENKRELIFEPFQQADGTTSRQFGGTGLGLSISREFTRLLGGDLRVDSKPGQGATFTLYLALAPGTETARGPAPAAETRGA